MPILFTDANVALSPQANGVYRLYRNGTLIYIGKADGTLSTIRTRLQAHRRGDEGQCTKSATEFDYEISTNSEADEAVLLINYSAANNGKLPECNEICPTGGMIDSTLRRSP